jgi:DNA invertase Pin-like site-specific DNA recombinase
MTTAQPTGMLLGYARVSTERQSLAMQLDALHGAGVDPSKVWTEKMSGAREDRPELAALLSYARTGDTIVVWRLDRLGRSLSHVVRTVEELTERGIHVRAITDGADSATPTGRLMIGILASLAEYERTLINERSAAARAARTERGESVGRPRSLTDDQVRAARRELDRGTPMATVCKMFGAKRSTLYRALAALAPESES